jgi:hypothetical protein
MADIDLKQPLENALNKLKNAAVAKVLSNIPPPNAPSTIKKKKSDHTLIDSGEMYGAIDTRIIESPGVLDGEVGIFEDNLAFRAIMNEQPEDMEFPKTHVPARPFLRPSWDENIDQVTDEMADEIFKQLEDQWNK